MLVSFPEGARNDELIFLTPELTIRKRDHGSQDASHDKRNAEHVLRGANRVQACRGLAVTFFADWQTAAKAKGSAVSHRNAGGCVNGPLGDLRAEAYEELLETVVEGNDISKLEDAAKLYTQRKFFRRAQELLVRASALRRGETRLRAKPLREHGELPLHSSLHLDEANASYVSTLPRAIVCRSQSHQQSDGQCS